MALSLNSNFVGVDAGMYISASLFQGDTLAGQHIGILPNVKKTAFIQRYDFGNLIQAYSETYTSSGTLTQTERSVTPTQLSVMYTLPIKQFEATWEATKMIPGAGKSAPSPTLQAYILNQMNLQTSQEMEYNIIRGNMTGATSEISGYTKFDGLLRVVDGANPTRVNGTTLSSTNIVDEMNKVYTQMAIQPGGTKGYKLFVSPAAAGFYSQKSAGVSLEKYYVGSREMNFLGVEVVALAGMPTNFMLAIRKENAWFATDLLSDLNQINLLDMRMVTGDMQFRYRADFSAGVQIGYGPECILYK